MKLEIRNLHKSFGETVVYDGLNMVVEAGERAVVLGRSGAGKSVMLKHLTGLISPDSGEIYIDGRNIAELAEQELYTVRMRFGMIFQNGGMLQSLSVAENVALPLIETKGCDYKQVMHKVSECLERVEMGGREQQSISTLSGGQKKRVAIARALVQEADCFLFDEPTAGLDPPMSETVDEIIRKVNEETGATVIVVTHDLVSAFCLGRKIFLLNDGRIIEEGSPEAFRRSQKPEVLEFLSRNRQMAEI